MFTTDSQLAVWIQTANCESVVNTSRPFHSSQRLRSDEVTENNRREEFQSIAPEIHNGLFSVPKMIE